MNNHGFAVILVPSTNHAMRAEKVLLSANITCKLIPVPHQISSNCGVCLRVNRPDLDAALQTLAARKVVIQGSKFI